MKFEDSRAVAENYDGLGLVNDIQHNLGFPMRGRCVPPRMSAASIRLMV